MKYAVIGVIVLAALYAITAFNKLVVLRNRVRNQWAQVDVQLKKRFDLIPNLVETVKGYAAHEKGTLEAVVQARNAAAGAASPESRMEAEGELTCALGRMLALSERYPQLKANGSFLELQKTLAEVESQIARARQFYNDTVMKYQNKRQMFPASLIAAVFGFRKEKYFEAGGRERENVKVSF